MPPSRSTFGHYYHLYYHHYHYHHYLGFYSVSLVRRSQRPQIPARIARIRKDDLPLGSGPPPIVMGKPIFAGVRHSANESAQILPSPPLRPPPALRYEHQLPAICSVWISRHAPSCSSRPRSPCRFAGCLLHQFCRHHRAAHGRDDRTDLHHFVGVADDPERLLICAAVGRRHLDAKCTESPGRHVHFFFPRHL